MSTHISAETVQISGQAKNPTANTAHIKKTATAMLARMGMYPRESTEPETLLHKFKGVGPERAAPALQLLISNGYIRYTTAGKILATQKGRLACKHHKNLQRQRRHPHRIAA